MDKYASGLGCIQEACMWRLDSYLIAASNPSVMINPSINPKDVSVHVVGKIKQPGWPTFIGNDVYFSGSEQLRLIRDIIPTK